MEENFIEKHGINLIRELKNEERRKIACNVAGKIEGSFTGIKPDYYDFFSCIYNTPMYFAEMPNDISPVNYLYKEKVMCISNKINIENISAPIVYECLHRIQDDYYKKIGLCNIQTGEGLMLNESANQYIVNKILGREIVYIDKFGIKINTNSRNHFPITTSLIEEIVLLIGDKELVNGTLMANGSFEKKLIKEFGKINYYSINSNFNRLIELKLSMNKYNKDEIVESIKDVYCETQEIIYKNYTNFIELNDLEDAKNKLNLLKTKFENTEIYDSFLSFYIEIVNKIKIAENSSTSLMVVNNSFINKLFRKFKVLNRIFNSNYNESSDK